MIIRNKRHDPERDHHDNEVAPPRKPDMPDFDSKITPERENIHIIPSGRARNTSLLCRLQRIVPRG